MKTRTRTFFAVAFAVASLFTVAHADPPKVVISDNLNATVNGTPAGTAVDVLANARTSEDAEALRAPLLDALHAWEGKVNKEAADERAAAAAVIEAERARLVALIDAELAEELKTGDGPKAARLRVIREKINAP